MGEFFQKFGEGMRKFPKNTIGLLAGGNYGGIFPEVWRRYARISKKQYWWEETMGEFFEELGEGMRKFQKKQYWREETMGEFLQKFAAGMREL